MKNFIRQTLFPALAALLIGLEGHIKSAEQSSEPFDKTASQTIMLDPEIVGEQPHGAYVPHIPARQRSE